MQGFDEALLGQIARMLHRQSYPPGANVFSQNDEQRDVHVVLSGHLRLTTFSLSGREVVFLDLFAGDIVGEIAAIDGLPRAANLVTVSAVELATMDSAAFNRLSREHSTFALALIKHLTVLVRALTARIYQLTAPVPTRICAELLRLAEGRRLDANTARITPAPKHADLANRVNTHREAVSRTMGTLQRQRILRRSQGEVVVLDLAALRAYAEGAPFRDCDGSQQLRDAAG